MNGDPAGKTDAVLTGTALKGGAGLRWPSWLVPIRWRFLVLHLLLVAVPIVGLGFARLYEKEAMQALESDLVHQAMILRAVMGQAVPGVNPSALLRTAARETGTRIRWLDRHGRIVGDSDPTGRFTWAVAAPLAEPPIGPLVHLALSAGAWGQASALGETGPRPVRQGIALPGSRALAERHEIRAALAGRYMAAMRPADSGERLFLCAALPMWASGETVGVLYASRSAAPVHAVMIRLRSSLALLLLLALCFTTLVSLYLTRTISAPLGHLTRVATAIANGDRTRSLALGRRDELGQLARAFASMTEKLDARAAYVADLAADLSHELKSPLTSLRASAELLMEGAAQDPLARDHFLANMLGDVHRLDRLVSRFLELSRVEAANAQPEAIELGSLLAELQREYGAGRLCSVCAPVRVVGRRELLLTALRNLVDNALVHATPGTLVTLRASVIRPGAARLEVHNAGAPIPAVFHPRLWERFFTTRSADGGTGLGLAIVRSVAHAHGGQVGFRTGAAAGTTFFFELPTPSSARAASARSASRRRAARPAQSESGVFDPPGWSGPASMGKEFLARATALPVERATVRHAHVDVLRACSSRRRWP